MTITAWGLEYSPLSRPEDDEPPLCLSHYYPAPGGVRIGPMVCIYDAGHPISGGPGSDHSGGEPKFPFPWNDAMALESAVVYRASARKTGPPCTGCNDLPQSIRGLCAICAAHDLAADNYETEMEDAA